MQQTIGQDFLANAPPDDSGSSTFARYKYQAKVAFPFFLSCAVETGLVAVILEHFEDLTLEYPDRWRLIQIKTRDASQGLWSLSDLVGKDGALLSLYRAYKETKDLNAMYELHLEQPVSPRGPAAKLKTTHGRNDPSLVKTVANGLGVTTKIARDFLKKVSLDDRLPAREHIDSVNLRLLMSQARSVSYDNLVQLYRSALSRIEAAMAAEKLDQVWPAYVSGGGAPAACASTTAKRLDKAECKKVLGDVGDAPVRALSRVTDPALSRPTSLEMKLLAAGAPQGIIEDAKTLRANAVVMEFEAQSLRQPSVTKATAFESGNPLLTDVQQRVLARLRAVAAARSSEDTPGPKVWNELMTLCHQHAEQLDPNKIFNQDPMLLVGEACELSDQCLSGWGAKDA